MPKKVEAYKAEDGRLFEDFDAAFEYEHLQRLRKQFQYAPNNQTRTAAEMVLSHAKHVHEILSSYLLKKRLKPVSK